MVVVYEDLEASEQEFVLGLAEWLMKCSGLVSNDGWRCVFCGSLQSGRWPHQECPVEAVTYGEYSYEELGIRIPNDHIGTILALAKRTKASYGITDAAWEKQLTQVCDKYAADLKVEENKDTGMVDSIGGKVDEENLAEAKLMIWHALAGCQADHNGAPVTVTRILRSDSDLCVRAAAIVGRENNVRAAVAFLLTCLSSVQHGKPEQGYTTWTLSTEVLLEGGYIKPTRVPEEEFADVGGKLTNLVNLLLKETGDTTFQLRQLGARFPEEVKQILIESGRDPDMRNLGSLFCELSYLFCVTGRKQGSSIWAFTETALAEDRTKRQQQFDHYIRRS